MSTKVFSELIEEIIGTNIYVRVIVDEEVVLDAAGLGEVKFPPMKPASAVINKPITVEDHFKGKLRGNPGEVIMISYLSASAIPTEELDDGSFVDNKDLVWLNVKNPEAVVEHAKPRKSFAKNKKE